MIFLIIPFLLGVLREGAFQKENRRHRRFVGVPGMSALAGHLAQDLDVRLNTRIRQVRKDAQGIAVIDDNGHAVGGFNSLAVTAPPQQAADLLDGWMPLVRNAGICQASGPTFRRCFCS